MTRPTRYLLGAAALLAVILLAVWLTRTGIATDSRKETKAKTARQETATRAAANHYRNARAHEDSAHHAPAPILVRPSDTARIRRLLSDAFRH